MNAVCMQVSSYDMSRYFDKPAKVALLVISDTAFLAHSANLTKGLYILPMVFSVFFIIF